MCRRIRIGTLLMCFITFYSLASDGDTREVEILKTEIANETVKRAPEVIDSQKLSLPYEFIFTGYESPQNEESRKQYCIAAKEDFRIIESINSDFSSIYMVVGWRRTSKPPTSCTVSKVAALPPGKRVFIRNTEIVETGALTHVMRSGVDFGLLVAPYKYYFNDGSLVPSSTIAPYAGWRWNSHATDIAWGPVIFAGPALIPASNEVGTTDTVFGLSGGAGFQVNLMQSFNISFVYGYDLISDSDKKENNDLGGSWIAFTVGAQFN
ncbi:hypothetical protein ST37_17830 [Vibrio sp. qd031]|uniref:hypothetical protein n=1 Tax=Vibrio sp. qd031 TaxID=1603038 RepID=UPI000A10A66C|nr:hypothetical protein [Vibrio sp. qd031]ORT48610.1 hypothetical protein ST37_17830 [Vibrio sp. qd031]